MSVVIRLTRTGKTHNISYRLVATDSHNKRDGKFLEILGFYNPKNGPAESFKLEKERYDFWLSKGAKPSPTVAELVETNGNPKPRVNKKKEAAKAKKEAESKAAEEQATQAPTAPQSAEAPPETVEQTASTEGNPEPEAKSDSAEAPAEPEVEAETQTAEAIEEPAGKKEGPQA